MGLVVCVEMADEGGKGILEYVDSKIQRRNKQNSKP